MKNLLILKISLCISLSLFLSCKEESQRIVGNLFVQGLKRTSVTVYQENDFDIGSSIHYDIKNDNEMLFDYFMLTGTHDYLENISSFNVNTYDSIIYITYIDSLVVSGIFDLKTKKGYPTAWSSNINQDDALYLYDSLFKELKKYNPKLKKV